MQTTSHSRKGFSLGQSVGLALLVWVGSLFAALQVADPAWRSGLSCGVVTGGLGGVIGYGLIVPTLGKPMNAVAAAMSLGFLGRMLLVAAGIFVTTRRLHGEPLGFAFAFFPLFFVFAALELLVVVRHAPAPVAPTQES